jgi:hypothetical protein
MAPRCAALRRARRDEAHRELPRPGLDVLNGDHHDRGRQHRSRRIGEQGKQHGRRHQQGDGVDKHGNEAAAAEAAVDLARPDVDAAGDAAKACRNRIGHAEPDQQPVITGAQFARHAGELGAQERIDGSDDRERQCARQDHVSRALECSPHGKAGEIDQHGAHRRACGQVADDRAKAIAKTQSGQRIVCQRAAAEPDEQRRQFRGDPPRVPHRKERQQRHQRAERLCPVDLG